MKKLILFIFLFSFLSELKALDYKMAGKSVDINAKIATMNAKTAEALAETAYINAKRTVGDNKTLLLQLAVINSDYKGAKDLFKQGANPNEIANGKTPLFIAVENSNVEFFNFLIKHKADIYQTNHSKENLLHRASLYGQPKMIDFLIKKGFDPNQVDKHGETPLHKACRGESFNGINSESIRLLTKNGANINAKDVRGRTPIYTLMSQGPYETKTQIEVLKYMIENGAEINLQDRKGQTPLMRSLLQYQTRISKILVKHGADVHVENHKGQNFLDIIEIAINRAAKRGNAAQIDRLNEFLLFTNRRIKIGTVKLKIKNFGNSLKRKVKSWMRR